MLVGCGGSLPARPDPEQAKQALRTALDAWQQGESIEGLTKRTPPIYFNDPKTTDGVQLKSYEFEGSPAFSGQSVRITVKATLQRDPREEGGGKERTLNYIVDIASAVVIVPE
jgi:hypothetical protein